MKPRWQPGSLGGVHGVAESVAARDLNHLYRTSCYFSDRNRYRAFCAMYAVMREVDDRVDMVRIEPGFSSDAARRELRVLQAWRSVVASALAGRPPAEGDLVRTRHVVARELADALHHAAREFPVPGALWSNFFRAMQRDLENRAFTRFEEFIEYAEGAAVAPTTIYLFLITAERRGDDPVYRALPSVDLISLGRDLGQFAYLAHVVRDLRQDVAAGTGKLVSLAAHDMNKYGVTQSGLAADQASGRASPPLRALVHELVDRAWMISRRGRTRMRAMGDSLSPDRAFILELIVRTYEELLNNIAAASYDPMSDSHQLSEADKARIVHQVATDTRRSTPPVVN